MPEGMGINQNYIITQYKQDLRVMCMSMHANVNVWGGSFVCSTVILKMCMKNS